MAAGSSNLQYASCVRLAFHFGEVGMRLRNYGVFGTCLRRQRFLAREMSAHLQQRVRGIHHRLAHQRRLRRALPRQDESTAIAMRLQRHRQCAAPVSARE